MVQFLYPCETEDFLNEQLCGMIVNRIQICNREDFFNESSIIRFHITNPENGKKYVCSLRVS